MKKIRDDSAVPPGGYFVYKNPEDGYVIKSHHFGTLLKRVKEFRQANNYPVGLNFAEEVEQNVCSRAAPGVCMDFIPPSLLDKATMFAKAMFKAAQTGFKTVSTEEVERRKAICVGCNYYGGLTGSFKVICQQCGCRKFKWYLASSACPINKW